MRAYYVVRSEGQTLTIERPGAFVAALTPTETPGLYALGAGSSRVQQFETPADGQSKAFLFPFSNRTERQVQHQEEAGLPSVDSIVAGLRRAHGLDTLKQTGAIRMAGSFDMRTRGIEGRIELLFGGRRARTEVSVGGSTEMVWITDDDRVFSQVQGSELNELEGELREQEVLGHPLRRLDDWRSDYASVEVLRRVKDGDSTGVLVRTVSREGSGSPKIVDPETGLLIAEDQLPVVPGAGRIGLKVNYGDYREVGSLTLPFRIHAKYALLLLGEIVLTFEGAEAGVDAESQLKPPAGD